MITNESMIGVPSSINVGTTPFGLSLRYSGLSWSPAKSSSRCSLNDRPFFRPREPYFLAACRLRRVVQLDCGHHDSSFNLEQ